MSGDISFRPSLPGAPTVQDLIKRRDLLVASALAAEAGDSEETQVFEPQLRGEPKMVRREVRTRINRSASVMYWREVRQTEEKIEHLLSLALCGPSIDVNIAFDGPEIAQVPESVPLAPPIPKRRPHA